MRVPLACLVAIACVGGVRLDVRVARGQDVASASSESVASVATDAAGGAYQAKLRRIAADVALLESAIGRFARDLGRVPYTLDALRVAPGGSRRWRGPYLDAIPRDPWGNAYVYAPPGEHAPFDIVSRGADGVPGGGGEARDVRRVECRRLAGLAPVPFEQTVEGVLVAKERAWVRAVLGDFAVMTAAVRRFRGDVRRDPARFDELWKADLPGWKGPYLPLVGTEGDWWEQGPRDPWGHVYRYEPGFNGNPAAILTYGEDGAPGGTGIETDIRIEIP